MLTALHGQIQHIAGALPASTRRNSLEIPA
jgi:hypothetical protein